MNQTPITHLSDALAVKRIEAAYLNRRSYPKVLLKDPLLKELNFFQFVQWISIASNLLDRLLKSPNHTFKTQKRLNSLLKEKMQRHLSEFPEVIFTKIGDFQKGFPPLFRVSICPLSEGFVRNEGVAYTKSALIEWEGSKKMRVATKEECDKLLTLLNYSFLAWKHHSSGCQERMDFAILILRHSGIDPATLFKQFAIGHFTFHNKHWSYHGSVGIQLENGERRYLEPAFDSKHSLSLTEWLNHFRKEGCNARTTFAQWVERPTLDCRDILLRSCRWNGYLTGEPNQFGFSEGLSPATRYRYLTILAKHKLSLLQKEHPSLYQCFFCHSFNLKYETPTAQVVRKITLCLSKQSIPVTASEIEGVKPLDLLDKRILIPLIRYKHFIRESFFEETVKEEIIHKINLLVVHCKLAIKNI